MFFICFLEKERPNILWLHLLHLLFKSYSHWIIYTPCAAGWAPQSTWLSLNLVIYCHLVVAWLTSGDGCVGEMLNWLWGCELSFVSSRNPKHNIDGWFYSSFRAKTPTIYNIHNKRTCKNKNKKKFDSSPWLSVEIIWVICSKETDVNTTVRVAPTHLNLTPETADFVQGGSAQLPPPH